MTRVNAAVVGAALWIAGAVYGNVAVAAAQDTTAGAKVAVTQPVELPGIILQPGEYVFSKTPTTAGQQTIAIKDGRSGRSLATILAVPAQRTGSAGELVPFATSQAGNPTPIRFWFPAGSSSGFEFVYPRTRAATLAQAVGERVLSTESVDASALAAARVSTVDPQGQSQEYSDPVTVARRESTPPPPPNVAPPTGGETTPTTTSAGAMAPAPGAPTSAASSSEQRPVPEPTSIARREDPSSPTSTTTAPAPSSVPPGDSSTASASTPAGVTSSPLAASTAASQGTSTPATTTATTAAAATQGAASPTPQPGYPTQTAAAASEQTAPAASDATRTPGTSTPPSSTPSVDTPSTATTSAPEGYRQGAATAPAPAATTPRSDAADTTAPRAGARHGELPATASSGSVLAITGVTCLALALFLRKRTTRIAD